MKKIIALLLALVMLCSFAACGNESANQAPNAAANDGNKEQANFKALREGTGVVTPKWLTFDAQNLTGKVVAMPAREDIDCPIEEHLIVELYSR